RGPAGDRRGIGACSGRLLAGRAASDTRAGSSKQGRIVHDGGSEPVASEERAMMTGGQYKDSLKDGRATYFEGRRVDDLPGHAILGVCVENVARGYDRLYRPGADAVSPLMQIPRSADDLRHHIPLLHEAGLMAHVTYTSIM